MQQIDQKVIDFKQFWISYIFFTDLSLKTDCDLTFLKSI